MWHFVSKNIRHWLMELPTDQFALRFDALNKLLWRESVSVRFDHATQTLEVNDGQRSFHFCRNRRIQRYYKGIDSFLNKLSSDYIVSELEFVPGDVVVDCGANVGELTAGLLRREPGLQVIAIEPEELEARCADQNLFGGERRTKRIVLWKENTTLRFFSAPSTADSSVFETPGYSQVKEVPAKTLSSLLDELGVQHVRLLKLEAEGAEPEILEGALPWLSRIDYIAADLGPERGLKQEQTATPVINLLLTHNFELVDMKFDRVVCLFRNRAASRP